MGCFLLEGGTLELANMVLSGMGKYLIF
jgi:hypothetical protein